MVELDNRHLELVRELTCGGGLARPASTKYYDSLHPARMPQRGETNLCERRSVSAVAVTMGYWAASAEVLGNVQLDQVPVPTLSVAGQTMPLSHADATIRARSILRRSCRVAAITGLRLEPQSILVLDDAAGFIDFAALVFGACKITDARTATPTGLLIHAKLEIGVALSGLRGSTVTELSGPTSVAG